MIKGLKIFSVRPGQIHLPLMALSLLWLASCTVSHQVSGRRNGEKDSQKRKDEALIKKYEAIIGGPINAGKSLALYKSIDRWMGVPYRYGAMTRSGTDCSGFTMNVYREVYHIELNRSTEDQMHNDVRRIARAKLREGDLVFFKIEEGRKVSHVGIYLGHNKFVHASVKKGVCISDLTEKYYQDHFRKAGRVIKKPKADLTVNEF